jgi:hypothetical protein
MQANILGRTRGLKFGSLAAENIISELAQLGIATGGHYSGAMLATIVWWGLYNNAWAKKEILDVDFEQVVDWVDEHHKPGDPEAGVLIEIARCYEDSKASKTALATLETTLSELKKKVAKMRTTSTLPSPKAGKNSKASASDD